MRLSFMWAMGESYVLMKGESYALRFIHLSNLGVYLKIISLSIDISDSSPCWDLP